MSKDFVTRLTELHEAAGLGEVKADGGSTNWIYPVSDWEKREEKHISHGVYAGNVFRRDLLVLLINSLPEQIALNEAVSTMCADIKLTGDESNVYLDGVIDAFHALNTKGGADA